MGFSLYSSMGQPFYCDVFLLLADLVATTSLTVIFGVIAVAGVIVLLFTNLYAFVSCSLIAMTGAGVCQLSKGGERAVQPV